MSATTQPTLLLRPAFLPIHLYSYVNVHSSDGADAVTKWHFKKSIISSRKCCTQEKSLQFISSSFLAANVRMGSHAKSANKKAKESINCLKSNFSYCLVGLLIVFCIMLSVCSMAFCFLVNFKTSYLEYRVHTLEMERMFLIHPDASAQDENGTVPGLQDIIEKIVQEVRMT